MRLGMMKREKSLIAAQPTRLANAIRIATWVSVRGMGNPDRVLVLRSPQIERQDGDDAALPHRRPRTYGIAFCSVLPTFVKIVFSDVPSSRMPAIAAMPTSAAIKPYSMAVTPDSSRTRDLMNESIGDLISWERRCSPG